jgi:hypothetical protein
LRTLSQEREREEAEELYRKKKGSWFERNVEEIEQTD